MRSVRKDLRERVIALDGGACQVCGFTHALNVHHVVSREDGGLDALTNLVTLCPNHHAMIHLGLVDPNDLTTDPELRVDLHIWRIVKAVAKEGAEYFSDPQKLPGLKSWVSTRLSAALDPEKERAAYAVLADWRRKRVGSSCKRSNN